MCLVHEAATKRDLRNLLDRIEKVDLKLMKRCDQCQRPIRDGDHIRAVVLSIYHAIPSGISYAMEKPYECESLCHLECGEPTNA